MAAKRDAGPFPIRLAPGARAVEAALVAEIEALHAAGVADPRLLQRPVRVIVPSSSLRAHLAATLVARRGRALAGVTLQTLHAAALEIVEPAGAVAARGEALFPLLVRRHAQAEKALREGLDELVDGYGSVAAAVSDLLDAGFTADHADAASDSLVELERFPALVVRARATLRVAVATLADLDRLGVAHRAGLLARARECLERDPEGALPARAVLIHGFAEATGLASELLEALVRQRAARVFFDEPPDLAGGAGPAPHWRFSDRLRSRLAGVAGSSAASADAEPAVVAAFAAPGAQAEVREVARRIRRLLAAGQLPEGVAIVARDLSGYRVALRRHLPRLGIPFSGVGEAGLPGATRRRAAALLELLERRGAAPADRWLDALAPSAEAGSAAGERADLRVALRHIGAVRLEQVAQLQPRACGVSLPVFGDWEEGASAATRRVLPAAAFTRAVQAAHGLLAHLEGWARERTLGAFLAGLLELVERDLAWDPAAPDCAPVLAELAALGADLPPGFELHVDDFLLLLRRALAAVGDTPLGGSGGGVQILTVMEARARTWDALFLMGLNRDVFPRSIRPDPILPDAARRAIGTALPDMPVKATGHDEERYLFAQMLAASPRVTLSWQVSSDDGKDCVVSSLVERLRWSGFELEVAHVPAFQSKAEAGPHTLDESALRAGLFAGRGRFERRFADAFTHSECAVLSGDSDSVAAAAGRLAVLAEFEPPASRRAELGPYFGFVGGHVGAEDPRRESIWVTTAELVARCPWKGFLAKLLRLEPPPDPLAELPGSSPRLLGNVAHRALERIFTAPLPGREHDLEAVRSLSPTPVALPDRTLLETELHAAANAVLADEGIVFPGLANVLARRALPLVERACALEGTAAIPVLGAELTGALPLTGEEGDARELLFRIDRVDRVDGELRLTDYKTGKPISTGVRDETRRKNWLDDIAAGRNLQALVYARAAGGGSGRFLFLRPDIADSAATFSADADDAELREALDASLGRVVRAWDAGVFFPRLVEAKSGRENPACSYCELAIACVRGDSGARGRLERWLEAAASQGPTRDPVERVLLDLWAPAAGTDRS